MTNGDVLTGSIEEVNPSTVILVSPYAGRLLLKRDAVRTMHSDKPVTVVHADDAKAQRYVSPTDDNKGWKETLAAVPLKPAAALPAAIAKAAPPVPTRKSSFLYISPYWKNQASLGVVNNTGNDETTNFTGNLTLHYDKKPEELTVKFDGAYGMSNSKQTAGLFAQNAVYRRDLNPKFYLYLDDDARYDAIKGIAFQGSGSGGLGYYLARTDKFKLDLRGGPGFTFTKTFDGGEDSAPAFEAGLRLSYVFNERISATQEATYTTSMLEPQNWRLHSESALNFKLDLERGLGLKLGLNDDYENQPSAGRLNNDTRMSLSMTLDF
jgi:putative salt-induced outer membrane protein YdiY